MEEIKNNMNNEHLYKKPIIWIIIILIVLIFLLISIIIYFIGERFYGKQEKISEFENYISDLGFEVKYPIGWEINNINTKDFYLGGVQFFPKNAIRDYNKGQLIQTSQILPNNEMITIYSYFPTPPMVKELIKNLSNYYLNQDSPIGPIKFNRKFIDNKIINLNGEKFVYVKYNQDVPNSFKGVYTLSILTLRNSSVSVDSHIIEIRYESTHNNNKFSEEVFNTIINSFNGDTLDGWISKYKIIDKSENVKIDNFVSIYGDIKWDNGKLVFSLADEISLARFYKCPKDENNFRLQKSILINTTEDFENYKENIRKRGKTIKEITIRENLGFISEISDNNPDKISWLADNIWIDISNSCPSMKSDELLEIANSLKY